MEYVIFEEQGSSEDYSLVRLSQMDGVILERSQRVGTLLDKLNSLHSVSMEYLLYMIMKLMRAERLFHYLS